MNHIQCLSPARARRPVDASIGSSMYGRLFPDLPSFSVEQEWLFALGRVGGLCDCGDGADEPASLGSEAAGWPFFGQFIAHDITADRSAPQAHSDVSRLRNARSPRLNLEGLYGDGPVGHPFLFQRDDPAKLLTAPGGRDVLRNAEGTAIIGDPRNDSHVVVSQMHLAFVPCAQCVRRSCACVGPTRDPRLRRRRSRTALALSGCRAAGGRHRRERVSVTRRA